jgi:hypothetical protein
VVLEAVRVNYSGFEGDFLAATMTLKFLCVKDRTDKRRLKILSKCCFDRNLITDSAEGCALWERLKKDVFLLIWQGAFWAIFAQNAPWLFVFDSLWKSVKNA